MSASIEPDDSEQIDAPSRDQNHDETRRNGFDPEVAEDIGSDEADEE